MSGRLSLENDQNYIWIFHAIFQNQKKGISTSKLLQIKHPKTRLKDLGNERHLLNHRLVRLEEHHLIKLLKKIKKGENVYTIDFQGIENQFVKWILIGKYNANDFYIKNLQIIKKTGERKQSLFNYIKNDIKNSIDDKKNTTIKQILDDIFIRAIKNSTHIITWSADGKVTMPVKDFLIFNLMIIYLQNISKEQ